MLYTTIALFAIAAVLGLIILVKWLARKDAPPAVIYSHGIFAAGGLTMVIIYALKNPSNYPQLSIILFVAAALGGFYLFFSNMRTNAKQLGISVIHAFVAVVAFVTLLLFAFT